MSQNNEKSRCSNSTPDLNTAGHTTSGEGHYFEICVKGHLDSTYSEWLDGLEVKLLENGDTLIFGPVVDQSALLGVLNKLGRLNLTLISVNEKT